MPVRVFDVLAGAAAARRTRFAGSSVHRTVTSFALVLVLGACSGDSARTSDSSLTTGDNGSPPTGTIVSSPYDGAGIWQGTLTRGGGVLNIASCLITEAGEFSCLLYAGDSITALATDPVVGIHAVPPGAVGGMRGRVEDADTSNLGGSGMLYAAPGGTLSDGSSTVAAFTITGGKLTDIAGTPMNPVQKQLDLTMSSLGVVSTLQAEFDHYYLRELHGGTAGDWIQGVYATFEIFDDSASLSIDAGGALTGQSASGCVLSGHIGIIDPKYNGYAVDLEVTGCADLAGEYAGLAFLNDFLWANGTDDLRITAFNDSAFIGGDARKYERAGPN